MWGDLNMKTDLQTPRSDKGRGIRGPAEVNGHQEKVLYRCLPPQPASICCWLNSSLSIDIGVLMAELK